MPLIKPKENWKDETSNIYDGPPPTPGTYKGKIVRMGLSEVQKGDNAGTDKWVVSVQITQGKFKGASLLHNFVMLKQNAWSFNQFLSALTDGSDKQKETIKSWYYEKGYKLEDDEKYKGLGRQIEFIGKPVFKPIGKEVTFVVTQNGEYTNVDKFLVPLEGGGSEEPEEETAEESGLEEFAEETTENPEEEAVAEEPDSDDPWS